MSLEYYKKQMIDLRERLAREKEAKKHDNESYAHSIKYASTPSSKASLRKAKIDRAASHDRQIESIKRSIDSCKENIDRERRNKR